MKTDAIAEQFKAITGLDKDLYREIVWFRQEHLKELLMPRHETGKDVWMNCSVYPIMKLLGVILRSISGIMKLKRRVYEKDPDVIGLEKLSNEYNKTSEEYTLLEMDLETSTQKLVIAKKALDEADSKLKKLEEKQSSY